MKRQVQLLVGVVILTLLADAWVSYRNVHALLVHERSIASSYARLNTLETTLSSVKDAETGQRGFLLTGDEEYLAPYHEATAALDTDLRTLRAMWPAEAASDVDALARLIRSKQQELQQTIELRRAGHFTAADLIVRRGRGRLQMEAIRAVVGTLRAGEQQRLAAATSASASARRTVFNTVVFSTGIALALIVVCMFMIRRDLAHRARVAEERTTLLRRERAARDEAERANRLKDDFLATLSHELRNPLHAVVGWLQLLRMRADDSAFRGRALDTIQRNAHALQRMIEDLLDASRASRGKLDLKLSPTPFATLVESVLETLRPTAASRGVRLTTDLASADPIVVGDADRLGQVVINLVTNAIKFTPDGGRVDVRLVKTDTAAILTVTDTGRGISAEALPHVFEPFRQAGPPMAGSEGGLGLGLAVSKQIVDLHGGAIAAESPGENAGARFTVSLPLAPAPVGADQPLYS